jgi:probable phosphoglycerate mutase
MSSAADTHLIAIRHGETEWNSQGRFQGHLNSVLNQEGRAQADALGERLARERFDLLLSSDLGRALQTASAIAMRTGHEIVVEPLLRDRRVGIFQGLPPAEAQSRYPANTPASGPTTRITSSRTGKARANCSSAVSPVSPSLPGAMPV